VREKFHTHTKLQAKLVLCILFLESRQTHDSELHEPSTKFNLLWISSWMEFWFVNACPNIWILHNFQCLLQIFML
jgi:hypothetical protein